LNFAAKIPRAWQPDSLFKAAGAQRIQSTTVGGRKNPLPEERQQVS
jgi:hypothetical protein